MNVVDELTQLRVD